MLIKIEAHPHVFISVPIEALADAGIGPHDAFEVYAKDDKVIIKKADPDDYDCDGDCENCPFAEADAPIVKKQESKT